MVRVDVRHEGVARTIDAFANDTAVLLLAFGVLVGDVPLQRCLRTQYFTAQLASEHLLGRHPL